MVRVSKDPEERKNEIMDAALELFNKNGYEQTAVSDIVKKVGVAQGTFYYYFDSKDKILDAIIERFMEGFKDGFESIGKNTSINAIEKTQMILELFFKIGLGYDEGLVEYVHQEGNSAMHSKVEEKVLLSLKPTLLQIINEGISQGVFHVDYPEESIEILLYGSTDLIHKYYFSNGKDLYNNLLNAMTDIVERLFGAQKGSFKVQI